MPKLSIETEDEICEFTIEKINREKLYGKKSVIAIDNTKEECVPAYLTDDGMNILNKGNIANLYVTEDTETISKSDIIIQNKDGCPLLPIASSLKTGIHLNKTVKPNEILDYQVLSVYQLKTVHDIEDSSTLQDLNAGKIFITKFNYQAGISTDTMFIFQSGEAIFGLICKPHNFDWCGLEVEETEEIEEIEDYEEDLDFSMM